MASTTPVAASISVRQTLDLLDGQFASVASGIAEDQYVLWLGSAISFGRVDGLRQVVARVLDFLRSRIDAGNPSCRFAKAFGEALELANLTDAERARIDKSQPFTAWPDADAIAKRLVGNYARLLDTAVEGEPSDYLVWEAVDVRSTFADPRMAPDVEHLCLAVLVLEGATSNMASANWDGLIECAVEDLAGQPTPLTVCAKPADLRAPVLRAQLIKFHGCAIRAEQDEANYRQFLVGRQSQLTSWITNPQNAALVTRLADLITTKPTLMIGLSTQDVNIQTLFASAAVHMPWRWPGSRPSYVFSENELGVDQRALLQNVYRQDWEPATRKQIFDGSRVQAYAKPLLVALVLHVLCLKVQKLIDLANGAMSLVSRQPLRDGVVSIRNALATCVEPDPLAFINSLIDECGRAMRLVRSGTLVGAVGRYQPISAESVARISGNPDLLASGLTGTAVAAGILGAGLMKGEWTISKPASIDPREGTFRVSTPSGISKVFLTSGPNAALQLRQAGHIVDADEPIVIHGLKLVPSMPRSPRSAPGRTGRVGAREVSIESLLAASGTFDELFQLFREELAI